MKNISLIIVILALTVFSCKTNNKQKAEKSVDTDNIYKNTFIIHTSFGDMKGRLYEETPLHRDNFIKLVEKGFYDSLLFHRVIKNFMIQGGDPESKNASFGKQLGNGGPAYTIPAEFNPKFMHKKGALSAARQGDNVNPKKESSGSQFYIVQGVVYDSTRLVGMEKKLIARKSSQLMYDYVKLPENIEIRSKLDSLTAAKSNQELQKMWEEVKIKSKVYYAEKKINIGFSKLQKEMYSSIGGTPHLDGDYTVFGEIYEGLEIIDAIANVKGNKSNRPINDVHFTIEMIK